MTLRAAGRRLLAAVTILSVLFSPPATGAAAESDVEVFSRPGCPRCADAHEFLAELARERPGLRIVVRDVTADPAALVDLRELAKAHGITALGVPTFRIRGTLVVGFSGASVTGKKLLALLDGEPEDEGLDLPWLGRVRADDLGLPAFTIAVGLVDGFNPCAMWVLLLVLSLLVNVRERGRMLAIGATFVAVSGLAYFAFMAAWLNLFLLVGLSRASEIAIGMVALAAGAVNLRDALTPEKRPTLAIPERAKAGIYGRMRAILHAESLAAAVAASAALALVVNVVELVCTAGLPLLYTRVLTLRELSPWAYYGYLALYNAAYVADDAAVLTIAVTTLSRWNR
jgi:hypothetical protein